MEGFKFSVLIGQSILVVVGRLFVQSLFRPLINANFAPCSPSPQPRSLSLDIPPFLRLPLRRVYHPLNRRFLRLVSFFCLFTPFHRFTTLQYTSHTFPPVHVYIPILRNLKLSFNPNKCQLFNFKIY